MPGSPAQTKYEETMDLQKVVMRTITKQSFEEFEPDENARAYRKEQFDGVWTVVEEYLFHQGTAQWTLDGTTSTEPLESNAIFNKVPADIRTYWQAWKRNPQNPILAKQNSKSEKDWWAPSVDGIKDPDFAKFYNRWALGYDSYLAPRIIIRMVAMEDGCPDQNNVGKIDSGWQALPGQSGQIPSGINFILTASRGQQEGDKWRNTYEWLASNINGRNFDGSIGWDPLIYSTQNSN